MPAPFSVEPWCVRETSLDLERMGQAESVMALSNGHIGLRANLDEGEPSAIPGTYLNSLYELRPLPYAEAGYGYPESGQTIVDVTNGKILRLLVDDEPFDVRYGELIAHERVLDLRAGTLSRVADWVSPAGKRVRIRSTRLVSFVHRSVAAIHYEVEAVENKVRVIVQSELVTNETTQTLSKDPRVAAALDRPLKAISQDVEQHGALLVHRTRRSKLVMAAGMDHVLERGTLLEETDAREDWARTTIVGQLQAGERLQITKFLGYGWSSQRSPAAIRDQVAAALAGVRSGGWDQLLQSQRAYLDNFWDTADVEIDGDPVVQQATRFGLFHILQAGARAERRALPAKGLTGPGYDGHAFWDTEGFVLPVLIATAPDAAADALRWRHSTLELAKERAAQLGLAGAAFPWRTIRGQECSAYWPAGTAAFHVNADIAYALERYRVMSGDDTLEADGGLELLVETARLWISLGHHDTAGRWHVDGVTGPDEYTGVIDDNVFTNLMAAKNLRVAADAAARHPGRAADLGVSTEEMAAWRDAAATVHLPYDEDLGVHPQSESFTRYAEWDFEGSREGYPLLLNYPYVQLYRKQVLKQADLVLAMHWCGEAFTPEQKARNVDYYERRTVRDSSLSACTQAVLCAEVGHLELAHDYLHEAALVDLRDLHGNTRDGLHMASMGGAWAVLVDGFGGLRVLDEQLHLNPQLPQGMTRLSFGLCWQGNRLRVAITPGSVVLTVHGEQASGLDVHLDGKAVRVDPDKPVTRRWRRRTPLLPAPAAAAGPRGAVPRLSGHDGAVLFSVPADASLAVAAASARGVKVALLADVPAGRRPGRAAGRRRPPVRRAAAAAHRRGPPRPAGPPAGGRGRDAHRAGGARRRRRARCRRRYGLGGPTACAARRALRARHHVRAAPADRTARRRAAPGCAAGGGHRRRGQGLRAAAERRADRPDAERLAAGRRGGGRCRRPWRARRLPPAGRPAARADARPAGQRPGGGAGEDGEGRGGVEARRHPRPGAPRRRAGARLHPEPGRDHRPGP